MNLPFPRDAGCVSERSAFLVVEKSEVRDGLWRFGRASEPRSAWGLIERNDVGGLAATRLQLSVDTWRDDHVTALCLVASHPDWPRIEHDLSWRPVDQPLYRPRPSERATVVASSRRETLGERAERLRRQR
jgi:hypothetical protein